MSLLVIFTIIAVLLAFYIILLLKMGFLMSRGLTSNANGGRLDSQSSDSEFDSRRCRLISSEEGVAVKLEIINEKLDQINLILSEIRVEQERLDLVLSRLEKELFDSAFK